MGDRAQLAKSWIQKAQHDLGMAKLALDHQVEYTDAICNHCHQACEKFLKAYLVAPEIPFEKKHDLVYLIDLIAEKDPRIKDFYDQAEELQNYAVLVRYPEEIFEPSSQDAQTAYRIALNIESSILSRINT